MTAIVQERYIWVHEEYMQIPGCTRWLSRSIDYNVVEIVPLDSDRGEEIMRDIERNALPGHTSKSLNGLKSWGWYEIVPAPAEPISTSERTIAMNPPLPAPTASPCICRHCSGAMEARYQPPLLPGRDGYWLLTCWNVCALNGYTFTNNTYPTVDLTPYLVKEETP